jgi:NADH-quinone oxidoreductase subunit A|tara:strand:+ start:110 stop:616 length:507 start_codon:yes stop_codon:yes gene_type:complete
MLGQYLPVVMLFVLGVLFALLSLIASRLLAPNRSTPVKSLPYECGVSGGATRNPIRFPVKFFLVAMIFIVFDIEVIFLYPYALVFNYLGSFGLVAIGIFSFAVFESFVYLISNGALEWGPIKRVARPISQVTSTRTTSSTIRRVGTKGREDGQKSAETIEEFIEREVA